MRSCRGSSIRGCGDGEGGDDCGGRIRDAAGYLEMLAGAAPKRWELKNLQVVIATEPINGNAAP
jgi:hypothetical protein